MFVVNHCYKAKALNYVRWHGKVNFGEGGEGVDVMCVLRKYGIVPQSVYPGLNYGTKKNIHGEMDKVLKNYVETIVKEKRLTTAWDRGFNDIVDEYLGKLPTTFTYDGKQYTPKSFLKEVVKVNPDDYVGITSFTHHPFYKKCILEMPDNWEHASYYNVPLNDMMRIIDYSLKHGYTVLWGADVSEPYFSFTKGIAVVPKSAFDTINGVITPRWDTRSLKYDFTKHYDEMTITQDLRQRAFDDYMTTDDHGMHIIGMAHDQKGEQFYIVKNSWGTKYGYKGYWYVSRPYVEYKTMTIMVNKNAIPKDIRKKLGL
jgi:bleomycin hydrolase